MQSGNKELRLAAHTLARRFGPKASPLAEQLWPRAFHPKTKLDDSLEALSTLARIDAKADPKKWQAGLEHADPRLRAETVRWWREFKGNAAAVDSLLEKAASLVKSDPRVADDLSAVLSHLGVANERIASLGLPLPERDKDRLGQFAQAELAKLSPGDRTKRAAMGLQVFERNACTKCHTTATATTPLAPSLKGIAQQKADYLIESVLHPSKVIKTGWEVEVIETKDGKVITGLVKDEGKSLRVIQAMDYLKEPLVIDKANIEARSVSKISLMPEGQEATLSRREFVDLIAY